MHHPIYFFDPKTIPTEKRRDWNGLIGLDGKECEWQPAEQKFVATGQPITSGVIVAHYTKFSDFGIDVLKVIKSLTHSNQLFLVLVSGGPFTLPLNTVANIYARKTAVLHPVDDSFKRCFERFISQLNANNTPNFKLLEPFVPNAVALDILCQAYDIAHGPEGQLIPSSEVSNTEKATWWLGRLVSQGKTCCDLVSEMSQERIPDSLIETVKQRLCSGTGTISGEWVSQVRKACSPLVGYEQHENSN